jgi:HK97 gp10 family phage protein
LSDELQSWFQQLPRNLQRELAGGLREIADELAAAIRQEAPEGQSGRLRQSVRVRRGRKTLELFVEAGGELTTKAVREGADAEYDYALAQEFGNQHQPANPFFYSTYNARRDDVRAQIDDLVEDVLSKA